MKPWSFGWIIESSVAWTIIIGLLAAALLYSSWLFPLAILVALFRIHSDLLFAASAKSAQKDDFPAA